MIAMKFENIPRLATVFEIQNPATTLKRIQNLAPEESLALARECFQMTKTLFTPILAQPIEETFESIGNSLENLLFNEIYNASQRLHEHAEQWEVKLKILRAIPLFSRSSTFDLMQVATDMEERFFKAEEALLTQDEPFTDVFLVQEKAKVFVTGQPDPVAIRSGIFGEEDCIMELDEASATVRVAQDCTVYHIPRDQFLSHTRRIPGLQERIFQVVVDRAKFDQEDALKEKRHAEEQRQLTQDVLDNIGQGSFSINQAGEIGNFSKVAKDYLGRKELAGVPFADIILRKNRKALREYYRALNMLFGGNQFDPEVILSLLPDEAMIKKRIYKLHYFFMQDSQGYVASVFVRMEEITLERQLAEKEARDQRIQGKMQQNIGGFLAMMENIEATANVIDQFSEEHIETQQQPDSDYVGELMRTLHGSKGLSGQFEINTLKDVLHDLEDCLRGIDEKGIDHYVDVFSELHMKLQMEYMHAVSFKENLGEKIIRILEGISFTKTEYQAMLDAVIRKDFPTIRSVVLTKANVPAESIVANWEADIHRLAEALGKKIKLKLEIADNLFVPKELSALLNVELGHLYRNSVDHGIETREQRKEIGKTETGTIVVKMYQASQNLILLLQDDGAGLNGKKIKEIAKKNPNLSQALVEQCIREEKIWKILFMPGFSSAEKVTKLSGRGVGLDAVKTAINGLKGQIVMASQSGKGSAFLIKVPLDPDLVI